MNDEARQTAGPDRAPKTLTEAAVGLTSLQVFTQAIFDVLGDARDELDPRAYSVLLDLALIRLAHEAVEVGLASRCPR